MTIHLDTPATGVLMAMSDTGADGPRVEVCAWLRTEDGVTTKPQEATPATLRIGAEGLRLSAPTRTWYVAYRDLEGHDVGPDGVVLRLPNDRCLELRTPAPNVLQQHLEGRITAYARHAILAQRLPTAVSPTAATSQLLAALENPATPATEREAIATWLGTRPLERGDALYLQRIVRDIADAGLAESIARALDLDAA